MGQNVQTFHPNVTSVQSIKHLTWLDQKCCNGLHISCIVITSIKYLQCIRIGIMSKRSGHGSLA